MPYLATHATAPGRAAEQLHAARRRAPCPTASPRSAASRRTPRPRPAARPTTEFPPRPRPTPTASVAGRRLRLPGRNPDARRPARGGRFSWHAYIDGMVDTTGESRPTASTPTPTRRTRRPSRAATPSRRTRSSTSTRCSTSATARPTTCRWNELTKDLRKAEEDAQLLLHRPRPPAMPAAAGQCPPGAPEGAAAADAFLADLGAADPRLAGLQGRRPADRHLRRATNPPVADPHRRRPADPLRTGALLVSPFLTPGATDAGASTLLAAALDRGPVRAGTPRAGRGGEDEVLRRRPAGGERGATRNRGPRAALG